MEFSPTNKLTLERLAHYFCTIFETFSIFLLTYHAVPQKFNSFWKDQVFLLLLLLYYYYCFIYYLFIIIIITFSSTEMMSFNCLNVFQFFNPHDIDTKHIYALLQLLFYFPSSVKRFHITKHYSLKVEHLQGLSPLLKNWSFLPFLDTAATNSCPPCTKISLSWSVISVVSGIDVSAPHRYFNKYFFQ